MVAGYFCEGPIYVDSDNKHYGVAYNNDLFSRYFKYCNRLKICMRIFYKKDCTALSEITLENIDFYKCINLSSVSGRLKKHEAKKTIEEVLTTCDFAIIRLPSYIGGMATEVCNKKSIPYIVEMVGCPWDSLRNHSLLGKMLAPSAFLHTLPNS